MQSEKWSSHETSVRRVLNLVGTVNFPSRRNSPAALRFAERRRREDDAPRLSEEIPDLLRLELRVEDAAGMLAGASPMHIRRIVVERAPALFLLSCQDPRCADGGHDVTAAIMRALRERQTSFQGKDECTGSVGQGYCSRVMHFAALAEYRSTARTP
jgi:hypothetical protein